jgi:hypothetical protein
MSSRLPFAARHFLTPIPLALAILGLAAALPVAAVAAPAIIYGIDNNNDIYEIDPVNKTSALALVQPAGGFSNALAYDTTRDHLFFIGPDNGLKYWAQGSGTTGLNVAGSPAVGTDPNNAAYYDNAYWFFEHDSNVLHRWNLSYTGTGAGAVPSISGTQSFVIAGMDLPPTGSVNNTNSFGDIAINPTTGILYASTSRGRFYSVDLLNSMTFTQLLVSPGNDNTVGLQLSFNTDYSILYGHSYTSGSWYEVNPANGNQTAITGFSTKPFGDTGFRDLGGAAVAAVPEPSAAALACIGVAGAAWCLRRRRRAG